MSIPLSELLSDTVKIYAPKLNAAGIEIQTDLASVRQIVMRKGEIMQVISNLIANAGSAMPHGGTLNTSVEDCVIDERSGLLLVVEDSGVGIPEANLQKIFEPFFTTRSSIGPGIGLWVVKQFIEGHSGQINVQSRTDALSHGTKVSIFLPFENPYSSG